MHFAQAQVQETWPTQAQHPAPQDKAKQDCNKGKRV